MSINHAILGILSSKPMTGYDLKKIIQDSPFMPWSGNNNQIYKVLVELLEEGFVTNEVHHQDSSPSKKIYTVTEAGRAELKSWVLSAPEAPEFKKTFLIQLAWADLLDSEELAGLVTRYENEVLLQIAAQQETMRRDEFAPDRTDREAKLWDMIHGNILSSLRHELDWIRQLRESLTFPHTKEAETMNYQVIEREGRRYILSASPEAPIRTEQDAVDLVAAGIEQDTRLLMLHADALPEDFFKLRTGLAGAILQKFVNYRLRVAAVVPDGQLIQGKMKEMLAESNKGKDFRMFTSKDEAERWLLGE